jgi:hypothetical protein
MNLPPTAEIPIVQLAHTNMDVAELKAMLATNDIPLIEVEDLGHRFEANGLRVSGCLQEYVTALKSLKIEVAFVYVEKLEAEDFLYAQDEGVDDLEDVADEDLRLESPELKRYDKWVGEVGRLSLYAETKPLPLPTLSITTGTRSFSSIAISLVTQWSRSAGMSRANALKQQRGNCRKSNPRLVVY